MLDIPKYAVPEQDIRAALTKFGIRHDRVVKQYPGRNDYILVEEEEDVEQIRAQAELRRKQGEAGKMYKSFVSKYLKDRLNSLPVRPDEVRSYFKFMEATVQPISMVVAASLYKEGRSDMEVHSFRGELEAMSFKVLRDWRLSVSVEKLIPLPKGRLDKSSLVRIVQQELQKR